MLAPDKIGALAGQRPWCRRIAGAIALAGMAFYAVLFPWHTVSQAAAQLLPS
jgi:hypothetical protein